MNLVGRGERVLIVDDDAVVRRILEEHLKQAGFVPVCASGGSEALGLLRRQACDVIITDWMMPGIDGLDLCRTVRADPALSVTYVVMMTANNEAGRYEEAFDAGVDDFIPKPLESGVLLARLRAAIRLVRAHREIQNRNQQLEALNRRLSELACTDELTRLANRRQGINILRETWRGGGEGPLSCAMIDIDHFKQVNDTHGHAAGDIVLRTVAGILAASCRTSDLVCRFGGEEFLILFPGRGRDVAALAMNRLRQEVHRTAIPVENGEVRVTISVGIAERRPTMKSADELIRTADAALYAAKRAGRNTVRAAA